MIYGPNRIPGRVSLRGNNNARCLRTLEILLYISKSEQRRFSEDLLAKEFRDGTVFVRFTVDDIDRAWNCLKDIAAWNQPRTRRVGDGRMVLTGGIFGQVGARYTRKNDTYEVVDVDEGNHEIKIEIRYASLFGGENTEKTFKARIIRTEQANGNGNVVEFEFEQLPEDQIIPEENFDDLAHILFIPCFWPLLIVGLFNFAIILLVISPILLILKCLGMKPKPKGLFLKHEEATRLKEIFRNYNDTPLAIDAPVIDSVEVDLDYSELPVAEPVLPSGFGI